MDAPQDRRDVVQHRGVATLRQEYGFALGEADPRMIEVDVDEAVRTRFAFHLSFLDADQEGAAGHHAGQVKRVPAPARDEQVLALLEAQQRDGLVIAAGGILAQEDRVFPLHVCEFGRERQDAGGVVAVFIAITQDHAQVLVCNVVQ